MLIIESSNHPSCSFCWIKHEANGASHSLAHWSLKNLFWVAFDFLSGPPVFVDACIKDQLGSSPLYSM